MSDGTVPEEASVAPSTSPAMETTGDTRSVISELREKRRQLGEHAKPLRLAVPGYDDLLLIDYKWVPFADLAKNAATLSKINSPIEQQIAASCDTLIATCTEFLIRVGEEVRPLGEEAAVDGFGDPRLPTLLGFESAKNARGACRAVFANEYALIATATAVVEWLQDTTRRVNEDHLGN